MNGKGGSKLSPWAQRFHSLVLLVGLVLVSNVTSAVDFLVAEKLELDSSNESTEASAFQIEVPAGMVGDERFLLVAHDQVRERWQVQVNGQPVGFLDQIEQPTWSTFALPTELKPAEIKSVGFVRPSRPDVIQVARVLFQSQSVEESPVQAKLRIAITDVAGKPLPVRATIVDDRGFLAPVELLSSTNPCAVRTGVVYGGASSFVVGVMPGQYQLWITRGPEYERLAFDLDLADEEERTLQSKLRRVVDTRGWFSCDPHTHTWTHSRHGDATVEERVVTFAGEALELPISTDHNILADYEPAAIATHVRRFFTPVLGDEVTTKEAHFNVFPLAADAQLPDFRILDWTRLFDHMRQRSGAKIIILNHPHNVHNGFRPFDRAHLNPVSGRVLKKLDFSVDAMEVLSSSAQQSEMMLVFRDWFAMLNYGHRVVGLGASDVHDVNRYIVGQGRTYIAGDDKDVGQIDVNAACDALRAGRAIISMGLFVDLTVNGRGGVGDVVAAKDQCLATLEVRFPDWMDVDRMTLFANGSIARSEAISDDDYRKSEVGGRVIRRTWNLSGYSHDVHLVALATGPGELGPSWPIPWPYQPSSFPFVPQVVGATNPVWVDRDGDGQYQSARDLAQDLWRASDRQVSQALDQLGDYDASVAVQLADLALLDGQPVWEARNWSELRAQQRAATEPLRETLQ